jgi:hypothetical protein
MKPIILVPEDSCSSYVDQLPVAVPRNFGGSRLRSRIHARVLGGEEAIWKRLNEVEETKDTIMKVKGM